MTILEGKATWTLADRLRKSRMLADIEQGDIAERIGVARTTVSNWENGRSEPSATYFVRWSQEVEVSLEWLAEGVCARRDLNPRPIGWGSNGASEPVASSLLAGMLLVSVIRLAAARAGAGS